MSYNIQELLKITAERNFYMKRIVAFLLCLCSIAVICAGCGVEDALLANSSSSSTEATVDEAAKEVSPSDFEDSFKGLCSYFEKKEYIKNEENLVTKMDASLIGAVQGNKYAVTYGGKKVYIELYAYDLKNLNDSANNVISSVKKNNKFVILDLPEVEAYLSDNGKYLMVYYDESINPDKIDEKSNNYIHKQEVIKDFKEFHK